MAKTSKKRSGRSQAEKIFIAGSGGQGILFLGKALYLTACGRGRFVTYFPSYGAEVRGGSAKCMVTVSDEPISTPIFQSPDSAIILNDISLKKYRGIIEHCGLVVIYRHDKNDLAPLRPGQKIVTFSAQSHPAFENVRAAAAYGAAAGWFSGGDFINALGHMLKGRNESVLKDNIAAFEETYKEIKNAK